MWLKKGLLYKIKDYLRFNLLLRLPAVEHFLVAQQVELRLPTSLRIIVRISDNRNAI